MPRTLRTILLMLLLLPACDCGEGPADQDASVPDPHDAGSADSTQTDITVFDIAVFDVSAADHSALDRAASPDSASPDSASADSSHADAGPLVTGWCNDNGSCDHFESCNTCPTDCGSCDIARFTAQRARYVDISCALSGDGTVDQCAAGSGGPGRFNELQSALDALEPGDTLFIHPGDYWRDVQPPPRDSGGIYTLTGEGTSPTTPIILTAAIPQQPPVLHSCEPPALTSCTGAALSVYGDHVIVDHLSVRGRVQVWGGSHLVMQRLECWHGWGACDGNWACLRIESCTDCLAHHNHVHDVRDDVGTCAGGSFEPRETGLKEFSSTRAIWELNTVRDTVRWGYDLHRNSVDTTVRFNLLQPGGNGTGIHIDRSQNNRIYGNIVVLDQGCIDATMVNEDVGGAPHQDQIFNNTCVFSAIGIRTDAEFSSTIENNAMVSLMAGGTEHGNVDAAGAGHSVDHNAYDDNSFYHQGLYDTGVEHQSLAAWQSATGYDPSSVEAPGGPCVFVDPPSDVGDTEFDLRVASGSCLTMSSSGGEVGAYGVTSCVGHDCP